MGTKKSLIEIYRLSKKYSSGSKELTAVADFTLKIDKEEIVGLVGESGCGKSTVARTMLRLDEPTSGHIYFDGVCLNDLGRRALKRMRRRMQIIFQDPFASLNPRMTVQSIIAEPLIIHRLFPGKIHERVEELLSLVGLNASHMNRFPHEFSGGQRQRIGIARALAVEPEFLICDEPISALDVSIQAQVINLLKNLKTRMGLTYLFIAHDLAMIKYLCDRVAVMYAGRIMELASTAELYKNPIHPYTRALLSAIPIPDPEIEKKRQRIVLKGEIPHPLNSPTGCPFRTRCPIAEKICKEKVPLLREIESNRLIACHFADTLTLTSKETKLL